MFRNFSKIGKRELTFLAIAILMSLIVLGYAVYAISFLVSKVDEVLDTAVIKPTEVVSFKIDQAEKLRAEKVGK